MSNSTPPEDNDKDMGKEVAPFDDYISDSNQVQIRDKALPRVSAGAELTDKFAEGIEEFDQLFAQINDSLAAEQISKQVPAEMSVEGLDDSAVTSVAKFTSETYQKNYDRLQQLGGNPEASTLFAKYTDIFAIADSNLSAFDKWQKLSQNVKQIQDSVEENAIILGQLLLDRPTKVGRIGQIKKNIALLQYYCVDCHEELNGLIEKVLLKLDEFKKHSPENQQEVIEKWLKSIQATQAWLKEINPPLVLHTLANDKAKFQQLTAGVIALQDGLRGYNNLLASKGSIDTEINSLKLLADDLKERLDFQSMDHEKLQSLEQQFPAIKKHDENLMQASLQEQIRELPVAIHDSLQHEAYIGFLGDLVTNFDRIIKFCKDADHLLRKGITLSQFIELLGEKKDLFKRLSLGQFFKDLLPSIAEPNKILGITSEEWQALSIKPLHTQVELIVNLAKKAQKDPQLQNLCQQTIIEIKLHPLLASLIQSNDVADKLSIDDVIELNRRFSELVEAKVDINLKKQGNFLKKGAALSKNINRLQKKEDFIKLFNDLTKADLNENKLKEIVYQAIEEKQSPIKALADALTKPISEATNIVALISNYDKYLSQAKILKQLEADPAALTEVQVINKGIIDVYMNTFSAMADEKFKALDVEALIDPLHKSVLNDSIDQVALLFTQMKEFVIAAVLAATNNLQRDMLAERWINLAHKFHQHGDFFNAQAIMIAFASSKLSDFYSKTTDFESSSLNPSTQNTFNNLLDIYNDFAGRKLKEFISQHQGPRMAHISSLELNKAGKQLEEISSIQSRIDESLKDDAIDLSGTFYLEQREKYESTYKVTLESNRSYFDTIYQPNAESVKLSRVSSAISSYFLDHNVAEFTKASRYILLLRDSQGILSNKMATAKTQSLDNQSIKNFIAKFKVIYNLENELNGIESFEDAIEKLDQLINECNEKISAYNQNLKVRAAKHEKFSISYAQHAAFEPMPIADSIKKSRLEILNKLDLYRQNLASKNDGISILRKDTIMKLFAELAKPESNTHFLDYIERLINDAELNAHHSIAAGGAPRVTHSDTTIVKFLKELKNNLSQEIQSVVSGALASPIVFDYSFFSNPINADIVAVLPSQLTAESKQADTAEQKVEILPAEVDEIQDQTLSNYFKTTLDDIVEEISAAKPDDYSRLQQNLTQLEETFAKEGKRLDFALPGAESTKFTYESYKAALENARSLLEEQESTPLQLKRLVQYQVAYDVIFKKNEFKSAIIPDIDLSRKKPPKLQLSEVEKVANGLNEFFKGQAGDPAKLLEKMDSAGIKVYRPKQFMKFLKNFAADRAAERKIDIKYRSGLNKIALELVVLGKAYQEQEGQLKQEQHDKIFSNLKALLKLINKAQTEYAKILKIPNLSTEDLTPRIIKMIFFSSLNLDDYKIINALFDTLTDPKTDIAIKDIDGYMKGDIGFVFSQLSSAISYSERLKELISATDNIIKNEASDLETVNGLLNKAHRELSLIVGDRLDYTVEEYSIVIKDVILKLETRKAQLELAQSDRLSNTTSNTLKESQIVADETQETPENKDEQTNRLSEAEQSEVADKLRNFIDQLEGAFLKNALIASTDNLIANTAKHKFFGADVISINDAIKQLNAISSEKSEIEPADMITSYGAVLQSIGINIDLQKKYASEINKIEDLEKSYRSFRDEVLHTSEATTSELRGKYEALGKELSAIVIGFKEFHREGSTSLIEPLKRIESTPKKIGFTLELVEKVIGDPENLAEITKVWQYAQNRLLAFKPDVKADQYINSVREILNAFAALQTKIYQIASAISKDMENFSVEDFNDLYPILASRLGKQGPVSVAQIQLLNELLDTISNSSRNETVLSFIDKHPGSEIINAEVYFPIQYCAEYAFIYSGEKRFAEDLWSENPETKPEVMINNGKAIVQYNEAVQMARKAEQLAGKAKMAGPQQEKFSQSAQKHYAKSLGQVISTYGDWAKDNSLEIYNIDAFTFKKADESPSSPSHVGSDGGIAVKDFSRKGSYNDIRIEDFHERGRLCFESAQKLAENYFGENKKFSDYLTARYEALQQKIDEHSKNVYTISGPADEKAIMQAYKNIVKLQKQFLIDLTDSFIQFSEEFSKANSDVKPAFKTRDKVVSALKKQEQLRLQKVGRPDIYHIYKSKSQSEVLQAGQVRDQVDVQLTMSEKTNPSHLRNGLGLANAVKEIQGHRIEGSDEVKVDFVTYRGGEVPFDVSNIILRLAASEYNAERMLEVMVADKIAIDPNNSAGTTPKQPLEISISSMTLLSTWVGNSFRGKTDEVRMVEESVLAWRMLKQKEDPIKLTIGGKEVFVKFNVLEMNMAVKPIITKVTSEVEHNLNERGYYQFAEQTETFLAGLASNFTAENLAGLPPEQKMSLQIMLKQQADISETYRQASITDARLMRAEQGLSTALEEHKRQIEPLYKRLHKTQAEFIELLSTFKNEEDFGHIEDKKLGKQLKKHWIEYQEIIKGLSKKDGATAISVETDRVQQLNGLAKKALTCFHSYEENLKQIKKYETKLDDAYRKVNNARREIWLGLTPPVTEIAQTAAALSAVLAKQKSTPELDRIRKYCDITQEYAEAQTLFYETDAISGRKSYTKKENWYEFQARFIHIGYELGNSTKFKCKSLEDRTGKLAEVIKARSMFRQQEGRLPKLGDKSDKTKLLEEHMTAIEAFSVSRENTHYNGWGARGKQTGTVHEKKMAKLDKGFYSWSKIKPLKLAKTLRSRMDFLSRKSVDTYSSDAKLNQTEQDSLSATDVTDLIKREGAVKAELEKLIDKVRPLSRFIKELFRKAKGGNKALVGNLEELNNVLNNAGTIKSDLSALKVIDTKKNPELKEHKRLAFKFEMLIGFAFSYLAAELKKLKATKNTENTVAQTRRYEILQACRPLLKLIKGLLDALPSNLSKKAKEFSSVIEAIDEQTAKEDVSSVATLNASAGEVSVANLSVEENLRITGAEPDVSKTADASLHADTTSAKAATTHAAAILPEAVSNYITSWKNKIAELNKTLGSTQILTKGPLVKQACNVTALNSESKVHIEPIVHKGKDTTHGFDVDFEKREITYNNNKSSAAAGAYTKDDHEKADAKEMAYQLIKLGLSDIVVEIPQNGNYNNFQQLLKRELNKAKVSQDITVTFKDAANPDKTIGKLELKAKTPGIFSRLHKNNDSTHTPESSMGPSPTHR